MTIDLKNLSRNRRLFKLTIPNLGVAEVLDTPATSLTSPEWEIITLARQSYSKMWGGSDVFLKIKEDPFDGRPPFDSQYLTTHQIAKFISVDGKEKILTNRKVTINPASRPFPHMFDDITFWKISKTPLWQFFKTRLASPPEFQVAAISRTGTYPHVAGDKDEKEHDKTAIAWALMQIATTQDDHHSYFFCQLCPEFQEQVLTISNRSKHVTMLDFSKTSRILSLQPSKAIVLDKNNSYVRDHIFNFPGYWTSNSELFLFLQKLVQRKRLVSSHFIPLSSQLLSSTEEASLLKPDSLSLIKKSSEGKLKTTAQLLSLIKIFTKPRYCKYLIPLINHPGQSQLRRGIISEVGVGPFSSTLIPRLWRQSTLNLLQSALNKYQR